MKVPYPCGDICLVKSCCKIYCNDYYDFINYYADNLGNMTADEIHEFRMNTPADVKKEVADFLGKGKRYDYQVRNKNFVAIRSKDHFWKYKKRGVRSA